MATSARRCAGCGGPLPETAAGQRQVKCGFCGIVNDLAHGAPAVVKVELGDLGKVAGSLGRKVRLAVFIGVGITAAVVAAGMLQVVKPVREALHEVDKQAQEMQERLRPVAPAELATLGDVGWKEVQAPAPPSGWAAFDPVASIEWAMAIARAWQPDARLTRVDVTRVSPAGTLNLTEGLEDQAGYRFMSPKQIAEWERIADREVNARVPYELMMQLARQKVTAHVVRGRPPSRELPPDAPDANRLGDVLAAARRSGRLEELPFYNGYLTHLPREGWVWYLQSLSRRGTLPRVRARDGAVYPYRQDP
jgi:hypothetical protein